MFKKLNSTRSTKKDKKDKQQTQEKYKHATKYKRKKIPYVQVKQKNAKNDLIKNTTSKLHHIHQRRGILRTPSNMIEISVKTAKDLQSLSVFAITLTSEVSLGSIYVP